MSSRHLIETLTVATEVGLYPQEVDSLVDENIFWLGMAVRYLDSIKALKTTENIAFARRALKAPEIRGIAEGMKSLSSFLQRLRRLYEHHNLSDFQKDLVLDTYVYWAHEADRYRRAQCWDQEPEKITAAWKAVQAPSIEEIAESITKIVR